MSYHSGSMGPVVCPDPATCTVSDGHWDTLAEAQTGYDNKVEELLEKQRQESGTVKVTVKRVKEEEPDQEKVAEQLKKIRGFIKSDSIDNVEVEFEQFFHRMGNPNVYSKLQANEWELVSNELMEEAKFYLSDLVDSFFYEEFENGEEVWRDSVVQMSQLVSQYERAARWASSISKAVKNGCQHNPMLDLDCPSEEELLELVKELKKESTTESEGVLE